MPPPHVAVHLVQLSQPPHSQSIGHGSVLQADTACDSPVQAWPPLTCVVSWARRRVVLPLPQVTVQGVQLLHSPQAQSTGQPFVLQVPLSALLPKQGRPPKAALTISARLLLRRPAPQVFEQGVQLSHSVHLQSTAQPCTLQASCSEFPPVHGSPPQAACCVT